MDTVCLLLHRCYISFERAYEGSKYEELHTVSRHESTAAKVLARQLVTPFGATAAFNRAEIAVGPLSKSSRIL